MNTLKVNQLIHSFKSFFDFLSLSNDLTANLQKKVDIILFYLTRYPLDHNKMIEFCLNCKSSEYEEKFIQENKLNILVFGTKNQISQNPNIGDHNDINQDQKSYSLTQTQNVSNVDTFNQENLSLNNHENILNEINFDNKDQSITNRNNSFILYKKAENNNSSNNNKQKMKEDTQNKIVSANYLPDYILDMDQTPKRKYIPNNFNSDKKCNISLEYNRIFSNKYNTQLKMATEDKDNKKLTENKNVDLFSNRTDNTFQNTKLLSEVKQAISLMQSNSQFYKDLIKNQNDIYEQQQERKINLDKKYDNIFDSNYVLLHNSLDLNQSMKKSLKNIMVYTRQDSRDMSFKQIQADLNERLKQVKNNLTNLTLHDNRERKQFNSIPIIQNDYTISTQPQSLSDKYMLDSPINNLSNNTLELNSPKTPLSLNRQNPITALDKYNYLSASPYNLEQEINYQSFQNDQNKFSSSYQQNLFTPSSPFRSIPEKEIKLSPKIDQLKEQLQKDLQIISQQTQAYQNKNDFHNTYEHTSPRFRHPYFDPIQFPIKQGNQKLGEQYKSNSIGQYTTRQYDEIFPFEILMQDYSNQNQSTQKDLKTFQNNDGIRSPFYQSQYGIDIPNKMNNNQINKYYDDFSTYRKHLYIGDQKIY